MKNRHKGNALVGILAVIAVLVMIFAGLGLTFGWVTFSDSPDKSTIELNKVELKEDTDQAVKATEKFIKESAESVEQATEEAAEEIKADADQETVTPVPEETQPQPVEPEKEAT
ncbi:hypothetical protein C5Y96_20460 [Blastopirellula marina]|uniref:Uncharacterized protein n=1 Tax=Blastopirellula marina TaxID=124 RepID=A0A2S8F2L6_9BACT|nr:MULTISPECIES: hypothetical protein [Pirellulaceae]PQO26406.1 hypothetical protein C5Y96_20460 [Blastopirellula marina]RCS44862.1 hypothetical protein DTL36_20490 [Bremerella cremea]